jgi:hypothetical protein
VSLGFPFVNLVFVRGAAGSVAVLAVVFFLLGLVDLDLIGVRFGLVPLVVDASRVRHFHVAFALRVRSALVNGCGYSGGSRAYQGCRRRIPIVVVRVKVSGYGAG